MLNGYQRWAFIALKLHPLIVNGKVNMVCIFCTLIPEVVRRFSTSIFWAQNTLSNFTKPHMNRLKQFHELFRFYEDFQLQN